MGVGADRVTKALPLGCNNYLFQGKVVEANDREVLELSAGCSL